MSELPLNPTIPNQSATDSTKTALTSSKPSFLNPIYLWKHNRWLFVAYVSVAVIALLIISLIGLLIYNQLKPGDANQSINPTPTPTAGANTTHDSEDDDFFAKQPLTMIYYSFSQTTGNKNMYQATPNDQENRVIDIGFPDKFKFSASPDGKWLLRWNSNSIQKSDVAKPQKLDNILELKDKQQKITSVVWQADSASLAISTTMPTKENQEQSLNHIYILPLATLQLITVYEHTNDYQVELIKFPNANALYYVEKTNTSTQNLTKFNPQTNQVEHQFTDLNQNNLVEQLQYSQDMQWGFKHSNTEITRYNLFSMEEKVIYSVDRRCEVGEPNNNSIDFYTVAPSAKTLLVSEDLTRCSKTVRNRNAEPTPTPPTRQTTLYSLIEDKVITRKYNLELSQIQSGMWSPNESYLWLTEDATQSYVMAIDDLSLTSIPAPARQAVTKERVFIVGWLVN